MKTVLFDFDVIVYRAAFAHQRTVYEDVEGCEIPHHLRVEYKRAGIPIFKWVKAAPKEYALATARNIIHSVMDQLNLKDYRGYLTSEDKSNFRLKIEGNRPYKANRKDLVKPVHYNIVRDYLQEQHNAIIVYGQEADDALGMDQCEHGLNTIIASIDKDLLQIPGYHLNTATMKVIRASDPGRLTLKRDKHNVLRLTGTGFKWFCAQMLLGDTVDNIEGINGIGPKATYEYLHAIEDIATLWKTIGILYTNNAKSPQELMGTANLLWIRRKPEQEFTHELVKQLNEAI